MSVDRAGRDAFATALASFLRRETGRDVVDNVLHRLVAEADCDISLNSLISRWFAIVHHGPITEKQWLILCRALAFLRTDLDESRLDQSEASDDDHDPSPIQWAARCHTFGLLIALAVSYWVNWWWLFAIATLLSIALFWLWIWMNQRPIVDDAREKELEQRWEYYPFAGETEWLVHKWRLDEFMLPEFDATSFSEPFQPRDWLSWLAIPVGVVYVVIIGMVLLYMSAFSVVIWPVWLVLVSVSPKGKSKKRVKP